MSRPAFLIPTGGERLFLGYKTYQCWGGGEQKAGLGRGGCEQRVLTLQEDDK